MSGGPPNEIVLDGISSEQTGPWITVKFRCAARDDVTLGDILEAISRCPRSDWSFKGAGKDAIEAIMNPSDYTYREPWSTEITGDL